MHPGVSVSNFVDATKIIITFHWCNKDLFILCVSLSEGDRGEIFVKVWSLSLEIPRYYFVVRTCKKISHVFTSKNHSVTEYLELEGTHKNYGVQLLALHSIIPRKDWDYCLNDSWTLSGLVSAINFISLCRKCEFIEWLLIYYTNYSNTQ